MRLKLSVLIGGFHEAAGRHLIHIVAVLKNALNGGFAALRFSAGLSIRDRPRFRLRAALNGLEEAYTASEAPLFLRIGNCRWAGSFSRPSELQPDW